MKHIILKRIDEAVSQYSMLDKNDKVLVALSGGADSVCLLLALKEKYPSLCIVACHVNHMLRDKEAERDAEFAKALCERESIPFELLTFDVAKFSDENKLSQEEAARKIRYDFFKEVCQKHKIKLVATAHTSSDNAETVLFNLSRGTALSGLCGIPPKRTLCENICLIRPLIFATRTEVEDYLSHKGEKYVTDSTNLTDDYTRNYFRHNIIPQFKNINPNFEDTLKNTCVSLRTLQIFIEKTANNSMTDDILRLYKLDECILSQVIISLYKKYTGSTLIENVHITAIISLIRKCVQNGNMSRYEICLPDKVSAIIDNGRLSFGKTVRNKKTVLPTKEQNVFIDEDDVYVSDKLFCITVCEKFVEGYTLYDKVCLDKLQLSGKLYARTRRPGDTIKSAGHTKKLKDLFIKNKTPLDVRSSLPLICDDTGIIFIPSIAKSDVHKKQIPENNRMYIYIYSKTTL